MVRAEYIPAKRTPQGHLVKGTGRSKATMIGAFSRWVDDIPKELAAVLTDEEKATVKNWLDERAKRQAAGRLRRCLLDLPADMRELADNLDKLEVTNTQAAELHRGIAHLAKALRKAGYRRPAGRPATAAKKRSPKGGKGTTKKKTQKAARRTARKAPKKKR